jgi:hypothetical protein
MNRKIRQGWLARYRSWRERRRFVARELNAHLERGYRMSPAMYRRLEEEARERQEAGDDLAEQPSRHEGPVPAQQPEVPPYLRPDAFAVEKPQPLEGWSATFSATLAANLATILIVALAIVMVRLLRRGSAVLDAYVWLTFATVALIVMIVAIRTSKKRAAQVAWVFMHFYLILIGVFALLVLLGFAAGIK